MTQHGWTWWVIATLTTLVFAIGGWAWSDVNDRVQRATDDHKLLIAGDASRREQFIYIHELLVIVDKRLDRIERKLDHGNP